MDACLFEALALTCGVDEDKVRAMDPDEPLVLYLKLCKGGTTPASRTHEAPRRRAR